MKLLFPSALPKQIEALTRHHYQVVHQTVTIHPQTLSFVTLTENLHHRVQTRLRVASVKEINGYMLSTESAVSYRKKVFEKPKYKMEALEILKQLSGKSHLFVTAWSLKNCKTGKILSGSSETKVYLANIPASKLEGYVNDHEVISYVGGYEPYQTVADQYIERIEGSLTNLYYQLPLEQVLPALTKTTNS
jgi:predicted house-cleaning NTP pyrophosphatase (Maf/HAM1 superfamily)